MTHTLNPVITVTVSGPVGSGKSYVLARIEEVVKQEFGNSVIVDAADVDGERRMSGDDLSTWQKPRAGTLIRLEEYTEKTPMSYSEGCILRTNALLDVICPTGQYPWTLPDALHATIAALMTVYDQELLMNELRKLTGQPTECFSAPKYGKQEHIPVNTIPVNQPPRFFDEYILTPGNKAEHEEIKAALFREIRKIAEMQLGGGLDRVMARGEWESLFERVSPELLPLALAIGIMQTADKPHLRSLNT
ncbi:TPA: hypothetical protein OSY59_001276 [Escherichia coli]|uniref:hypothetical protein n=1 Tax=Escherichia coli TaxID=562 RepID=UPI000B7E4DFD|nr:hypothetical protein [Escherichia coli]EFE9444517.1 hypothetical protein [Escherichia coli]EFJ2399966.1 hypothetical protein [Escherichia coli]EFJ2443866.1 hypothetical protein [Escherichia coli]EHR7905654.1 hypothetical protein [Escherichia coli]MBB7888879.1 hypothetical protein [Escherichia coli]